MALLSGADVAVCALLLAIALAHAEPTLPSPSVERRRQVLLFVVSCLVSLAVSMLAFAELTLRIARSQLAGREAGPVVVASLVGQLLPLLAVALSAALRLRPLDALPWAGRALVVTAPLLPWATLADVPALTAISVVSLGCVAAASSLLLLAFLRALPRPLQPLGLAASLCLELVVEGGAELFGASLSHPGEVHVAVPLTAVVVLLATGLALLRASRAAFLQESSS